MAEQEKPKRKTKTSSAVKRRYNAKHYKRFAADVKIPLYDELVAYTEKEQISKAEFLKRAIEILSK